MEIYYEDDDDVIFVDSSNECKPGPSGISSSNSLKRSHEPEIICLDSSDEEEKEEVRKVEKRMPWRKPNVIMQKELDADKAISIQQVIAEITKVSKNGKEPKSELFQAIRQILDDSPLSGGDFKAVREAIVETELISFLLAYLSRITHHVQTPELPKPDEQPSTSKAKAKPKRKYTPRTRNTWTKKSNLKDNGTGFGSGAVNRTGKAWNAQQTFDKQKTEDSQVSMLLQVLASFINPQDDIPVDSGNELPAKFIELVEQSCLDPVLRSYLRNDSILDMTRHIPLYMALMLLTRAISTSAQLVHMLMMKLDDSEETIAELLGKIKMSAEDYANRVGGYEDDMELTELIGSIQSTSLLLESATDPFRESKEFAAQSLIKSVEDVYMEVMKPLQFESVEFIESINNNETRFNIAYKYSKESILHGTQGSAVRIKRLAKEFTSLRNSLPLSFSSSVFVCADSSRLDIMKFLITGPINTPYENGCFIFDVYFPPEYPNVPPLVNLETTGRNQVRFNPNLYACGKVCLSLLNTWTGRPDERWIGETSSFLQVLVSIQSLILVDDPYFNEPGHEQSRGTANGQKESASYNQNLYPNTVYWAMLDHLKNPTPCFKHVIQKHFWLKRNDIMAQIDRWNNDLGNTEQMKSCKAALAREFLKLQVPEGLEKISIDTQKMNAKELQKIVEESKSLAEDPKPNPVQRMLTGLVSLNPVNLTNPFSLHSLSSMPFLTSPQMSQSQQTLQNPFNPSVSSYSVYLPSYPTYSPKNSSSN